MFNLPLTKRYIPAITLLVIFIIFSHILISKVISSNSELAKIINISGKQRMLSQRLIILGQNYYEDILQKPEYKASIEEMKTAHKYLLTKIVTPRLENIYFKENLDNHLKNYIKHFDNLLVLHNPMFLKTARENSRVILVQLDQVVKEYERYVNEKLETTAKYEFYMMLATLFILLLEVFFIFRPASLQIERNTKELVETKEYEETIIESNHNAIIAIDWTGKITTYNEKAVEIFGWSKKEMIGFRNLLNIIPKKYQKEHTLSSKKYLETGKSSGIIGQSHEFEAITKDGRIFPIRISFGGKWKLNGSVVVASIVDISKQKEQEAFIIQQSKMASMGEMINNIAHQWRQPLSAISTSASGIQVEKEYGILTDDVLDERLESIVTKTKYLSQTIDDFMNFFKESKEKEDFIVNRLITNVENIVNSVYKHNNIILHKDYNIDKNIHCKGFANELSQVVINILNNAKDILIDTNAEEKIVKIELTQIDDKVIIEIHDSGGGIPADILPKIFDPYFTTKHKNQGTGIGLYMSSEIINGHFGGLLKALNKSFKFKDKKYYGACFIIEIPANI